MSLALFAALLSVPVAMWHGYLWHRLFHVTGLPPRWRWRGAVALTLLGVVTVLSVTRPRALGVINPVVCCVGFPWIGFAVLLACAVFALEPARAFAFVAAWRRGTPPDPSRRATMGRVLGGVAVAAGGGVALAGAAQALALTVQRIRVPLRRLPPSLSGTRIVQVSDLHLGVAVGPEYLDRVIAQVNALDPDLVAITGDLVDGSVAFLREPIARLRDLRSRYGVFFVTGNHEYYSGAAEWVAHLTGLGIRVLRNERVSIGGPEASFDLAGVDDWNAKAWGIGHGHDMPRALAGRDPAREVVLLAHQPASAIEAARRGVGLQLSGHTHGGQIFPVKYLLYIDQPFVDGLHRLGDTYVYVSRGTGYWGPPMRVGAEPEVTEVTLVAG